MPEVDLRPFVANEEPIFQAHSSLCPACSPSKPLWRAHTASHWPRDAMSPLNTLLTCWPGRMHLVRVRRNRGPHALSPPASTCQWAGTAQEEAGAGRCRLFTAHMRGGQRLRGQRRSKRPRGCVSSSAAPLFVRRDGDTRPGPEPRRGPACWRWEHVRWVHPGGRLACRVDWRVPRSRLPLFHSATLCHASPPVVCCLAMLQPLPAPAPAS